MTAADSSTGCLCAERGLLGDDEQRCGGYGSISDELCEQAKAETDAAARVPAPPPARQRCGYVNVMDKTLSCDRDAGHYGPHMADCGATDCWWPAVPAPPPDYHSAVYCGASGDHRPHEWYDGALRRDCPGVPAPPQETAE